MGCPPLRRGWFQTSPPAQTAAIFLTLAAFPSRFPPTLWHVSARPPFYPHRVLADAGTHLLPPPPFQQKPESRFSLPPRWGKIEMGVPPLRRGWFERLFHKSSPMIYAKHAKTIFDDSPRENMEYGPKIRHSGEKPALVPRHGGRNPDSPFPLDRGRLEPALSLSKGWG